MIASGRMSPPIARRGMRSWQVVGSLLLHLLVLALVVASVRPRRHPHEYVPPAPVAMVFENGGAPRPAAPKAQRLGPPERARPASRPAVVRPVSPRVVAQSAPPSAVQASPPPPLSPAAPHPLAAVAAPRAVPAPQAPPPPKVPPPEQLARAAPPPPMLRPVSPPPAALAPPGPPAQPSAQQYSVRLPQSEIQAFLQPQSVPAPRPFVPAPLPVPPTPPRNVPAPPAPPATRYLVMNNLSYGGAPQGGAAAPSPQSGQLNLALNQSVMRNAFAREFSIQGNIGPDWKAELSQWVNERKYYPQQALQMDQQGAVAIRLVVARDGSVRDVTLLQSSGSPFLDQAWLGLFQGARVPPFPPGTPADQITLEATMHFILVND